MVFTKPGIYAATVILLDPLMSACNVRYSFIIKVMGKSNSPRRGNISGVFKSGVSTGSGCSAFSDHPLSRNIAHFFPQTKHWIKISSDLDTLGDQAFLMIVIITISFLLALGSFYMLQPTINHYIRKSVHRLSQSRKSKAVSRLTRRSNTRGSGD